MKSEAEVRAELARLKGECDVVGQQITHLNSRTSSELREMGISTEQLSQERAKYRLLRTQHDALLWVLSPS